MSSQPFVCTFHDDSVIRSAEFASAADMFAHYDYDNMKTLVARADLGSLSWLPRSLRELTLDCSDREVAVSLPELPTGLLALEVRNAGLTACPVLPPSLTSLVLRNLPLSDMPPLPLTLKTLEVSHLPIVEMTALPDTLTSVRCYGTEIREFPAVERGVEELCVCDNPRLARIPSLHHVIGLRILWCRGNALTELPALPNTLQCLDCRDNQISAVPISLFNCMRMRRFLYSGNATEDLGMTDSQKLFVERMCCRCD
jgi:Leucine-rich repeat (LRR) protein